MPTHPRPTAPRPLRVLLALAALALASLVFALAQGSVALGPAELWNGLRGAPGLAAGVIWELRLPRAVAAFATGGLLALAGALMQVLLRNPLADPYVLGVSGGAAAGALSLMLLGVGGLWINAGAGAGALASMLLVFGLAHGRGAWTPLRLLLTGVIVAAGWGALITLLLALAPDRQLRGMLFWLMGDLAAAPAPGGGLVALALGLAASLPLARALNVLAHGELTAASLGVAVRPLRLAVYALASLLAGAAVTLAGSVGFVGLVIPHLLRLALGADHRLLLPGCVLAGGTLLTVADTLARSLIAPQQLPVGAITALLGVPLFLYLLHGSRRDDD
ncbi:iron complex transport system permease protein [Plasticicumulans lactativorans]|uniref:Iron complex transport system permease protein n=1 Tax=Plasticicumulans lactativorans TaxID=1133106 RepID=A0A4R2LFE8_9GAMM|nr:iron ABC transporter permease [Plasticicumulans lactativorans]TCO81657.1 iron complex transport system permease protein [Plasticicumulans lactativorans]